MQNKNVQSKVELVLVVVLSSIRVSSDNLHPERTISVLVCGQYQLQPSKRHRIVECSEVISLSGLFI